MTSPLAFGSASLEDVSAYFEKRLQLSHPPRSIAEMQISIEDVTWLKDWFRMRADQIAGRVEGRSPGEGSSEQQMFGLLFLIFAAETARESSGEDSIWPSIHSRLPDNSGLRKRLFVRGQPSRALKAAIEGTVRHFELRHVLDSDESYKYFDTIKLQFGFTFWGATRRLHEWLIGLGVPVVVRVLLGEEPKYPGLQSTSFTELWETLHSHRKRLISFEDARERIRSSPWVRPHWIEPLLRQSTARHDRATVLVSNAERLDVPVLKLGLHWPPGDPPKPALHLNRDYFHQLANRTTSHQLVFHVDAQVVERWLRQPGGRWSGRDHVLWGTDSSPEGCLKPSQLTVMTSEGHVIEETDLTTLFELQRDVLIFDLVEGSLVPDEQAPLNPRREYALVTDGDLALKGISTLDWRRVGSANVYRLSPPWSPEVSLTLEDLEFWTPNIASSTPKRRISLSLVSPDRSPILIGSTTRLCVENVPESTESATLILDDKRIALSRDGHAWVTSETIDIGPELVLGLHKSRVELRDTRSRRTYPIRTALLARGTLVHERDQDSDGGPRWKCQKSDQPLNIASGGAEVRFLGHDVLGTQTLFEGYRSVGSLPKRAARLSTLQLHGWGAPLTTEDESEIIASAVEDRGCVYYSRHHRFLGNPIPATISLRNPIEPSEEHSVNIWRCDPREPAKLEVYQRSDISPELRNQVWRIDEVFPKLNALAVACAGECLGRWWDLGGIANLVRDNPTSEVFALLRWFKPPLLSNRLAYSVQGAVHRAPVAFIRAWLLSEGLPAGLRQKPVDAGMEAIVRHFL